MMSGLMDLAYSYNPKGPYRAMVDYDGPTVWSVKIKLMASNS